eukprot:4493453-Amphidinium_carterae.1
MPPNRGYKPDPTKHIGRCPLQLLFSQSLRKIALSFVHAVLNESDRNHSTTYAWRGETSVCHRATPARQQLFDSDVN